MLLALALGLSAHLQAAVGRTVLATVRDLRNRPIVDLEADDFVVREAGQPREILSAHVADYPVFVLIDNSAAAGRDVEAMKSAAARFIVRIGNRPVALGTFGDTPVTLATFADDRTTVLARLAGIRMAPAGTSGGARVMHSLADAAGAIRSVGATFSAIVVLSGSDDAAARAPTDVLAAILGSQTIVHVVEHRPASAGNAPNQLSALATQTRGQATAIYTAASFQIALDRLADQLAAEMMIEYLVPPDAPPAGDATVGVRLPGARVVGLGVR